MNLRHCLMLVAASLPTLANAREVNLSTPTAGDIMQPVYAEQLRSRPLALRAGPRAQATGTVGFFDPQVILHELLIVPTESTQTGYCEISARVHDATVAVSTWQASPESAHPDTSLNRTDTARESAQPASSGSLVRYWQPSGSQVQGWQPPAGVFLTPSDLVVLKVRSRQSSAQDTGQCKAEVHVLAFTTTPTRQLR
ncbi:MAG: hypothetical protein ACR2QB_07725 [Gammaproteobacteria bacterium]